MKAPKLVTAWPHWFGIDGNVTVVPESDYDELRARIAKLEAESSSLLNQLRTVQEANAYVSEQHMKAVAEKEQAVLALRSVEFDCRGKCVACTGWNVDPGRGETPHKHTADCPVAAVLGARSQGEGEGKANG